MYWQDKNVCIDDIIIFLRTWEEHILHIKAVLEASRANNMMAKTLKSKWGAWSLEYLGHTLGDGKVSVPEVKMRAIKEFIRPVTKKDLRLLLGTTSYYRLSFLSMPTTLFLYPCSSPSNMDR